MVHSGIDMNWSFDRFCFYLQAYDLKKKLALPPCPFPPPSSLPQGDSSICTLPGLANPSLCSFHDTVTEISDSLPVCFEPSLSHLFH